LWRFLRNINAHPHLNVRWREMVREFIEMGKKIRAELKITAGLSEAQ
jgi:hypothetical protein